MFFKEIKPNLYLVNLDLNIGGFKNFISAWIYKKDNLTLVVDPGPQSTVHILIDALKSLGVKTVNYLLLTHIHIDHAGGSGALMEVFPEAKVVCHPKASRHLLDPDKLWQGTLKVLGKSAEEYYGGIKALPATTKFIHEDIITDDINIKVIATPGHAAHHLCFQLDGLLFAGEALGVCLTDKPGFYHRPATPPVFKYEIFADSVKNIARLEDIQTVCFGHYGALDMQVNELCEAVLRQLDIWLKIVSENRGQPTEKIRDKIIEKDSALAELAEFPPDIYRRELSFFLNSISGMSQYLLEKQS